MYNSAALILQLDNLGDVHNSEWILFFLTLFNRTITNFKRLFWCGSQAWKVEDPYFRGKRFCLHKQSSFTKTTPSHSCRMFVFYECHPYNWTIVLSIKFKFENKYFCLNFLAVSCFKINTRILLERESFSKFIHQRFLFLSVLINKKLKTDWHFIKSDFYKCVNRYFLWQFKVD